MEFNGRYALITGCGSGMGRIYALRLASEGYGIVAVDINSAALDDLCSQLFSGEGPSVPVIPIAADLSKSASVQLIASKVDEAGAVVEVLVNNAGMIFTTPIADTAPAKLEAMMGLHCTIPLLLCREFVPRMKAVGKGYVLNISSICAWMPWPVIGMYGNTKRFIKGYSRSLRVECAGSGVSVTTAFFGAVDTPLFGFSEKLSRLMLSLGVMISPQKAVDKALAAMFRRKKSVMPGLLNKITVAVVPLVPDWLLVRLVRRYARYLTKK